jgi:hypothetical protein
MDSSGAGVSEVLVTSYTCMSYFTLGRTEAICLQVAWQYHGLYACCFQNSSFRLGSKTRNAYQNLNFFGKRLQGTQQEGVRMILKQIMVKLSDAIIL